MKKWACFVLLLASMLFVPSGSARPDPLAKERARPPPCPEHHQAAHTPPPRHQSPPTHHRPPPTLPMPPLVNPGHLTCDDGVAALTAFGDILAGVIGLVPEIGSVLSGVLLAFWPEPACSADATFDAVTETFVGQYVESQLVAEQKLQLSHALTNLRDLMHAYEEKTLPNCTDPREAFHKRTALDNLVLLALEFDPMFFNPLFPEYALPQLVLMGTASIAIHREAALFYGDLSCGTDPDAAGAMQNLANTIARYAAAVQLGYINIITARMVNITNVVSAETSPDKPGYGDWALTLSDAWQSPTGSVVVATLKGSHFEDHDDTEVDYRNFSIPYMREQYVMYNVSKLEPLDIVMQAVLAPAVYWAAALPGVAAASTKGTSTVVIQPPMLGGLCWEVSPTQDIYNPTNNCQEVNLVEAIDIRVIDMYFCAWVDTSWYETYLPYSLGALIINEGADNEVTLGTIFVPPTDGPGAHTYLELEVGEFVTRVDVGMPFMDSAGTLALLTDDSCFDDFKVPFTTVAYLKFFTNKDHSLTFDMKKCNWYENTGSKCAAPTAYNITTIQVPEGSTTGIRFKGGAVNPNVVINHPKNDAARLTVAGLQFEYTESRPWMQSTAPQTLRSGVLLAPYDQAALCVQGNGLSNQLTLANCNTTSPSQLFLYNRATLTIKEADSGLCFDVDQHDATPGTAINLYTCNGLSNQQFIYTASGQLLPAFSPGLCVDVKGAFAVAGTPIDSWPCAKSDNQNFVFV